jgi:hypothetical protein
VFRYVTDAEAEAEKARRDAGGKTNEQKSADPKTQKENAPGKTPGASGS